MLEVMYLNLPSLALRQLLVLYSGILHEHALIASGVTPSVTSPPLSCIIEFMMCLFDLHIIVLPAAMTVRGGGVEVSPKVDHDLPVPPPYFPSTHTMFKFEFDVDSEEPQASGSTDPMRVERGEVKPCHPISLKDLVRIHRSSTATLSRESQFAMTWVCSESALSQVQSLGF